MNNITDKVLNTLSNADIPLSEEHPELGKIEVPTSEL
jgi:hypothetical protein